MSLRVLLHNISYLAMLQTDLSNNNQQTKKGKPESLAKNKFETHKQPFQNKS